MELGDTPDIIHPNRKRRILSGEHPWGRHPALDLEAQKKLATDSYKRSMAASARYVDRPIRSRDQAHQAAVDMFRVLHSIIQRESAHKEALEQLAVKTVLSMPEFKLLADAVKRGDVAIDAKLERPDLSRAKIEEPEDAEDQEAPEAAEQPEEPDVIRQEIGEEASKRRLINLMIQGAAVTNNYAFAYYAADALNQIDPTLAKDYGKLMAYSELGYWVQDDEVVAAALRQAGSDAQFGASDIVPEEEEERLTIRARSLAFPGLVHELIKGAMEYLSINDDDDWSNQQAAMEQADIASEEAWHMAFGPGLWRKFMEALGDNQDLMTAVYDQVVRLPAGQFNALMKEVAQGTRRAAQTLQGMADKIRSDMEADGVQLESGRSMVRRLLD